MKSDFISLSALHSNHQVNNSDMFLDFGCCLIVNHSFRLWSCGVEWTGYSLPCVKFIQQSSLSRTISVP